MASFQDSGTFVPDDLIAGEIPPLSDDNAVLASGEGVVTRGTVLGVVTIGGEYRVAKAANADGSEDPSAILLNESVDATSASVAGIGAALRADINSNSSKFQLDGSLTLAATKLALRPLGIYLVDGSVIA